MLDLPELTPESFEILVVRELRKVGLLVCELRIHRCSTLPDPERGYLLELKGVVGRGAEQRRTLIGCLRRQAAIGRGDIDAFKDHLKEAGVAAGHLFRAAALPPQALNPGPHPPLALPRGTRRRPAVPPPGGGAPR